MTHDTEVQVHDPDPPQTTRGPKNSPWRYEKVCKRVQVLWANNSASQIADKIWAEFQIKVSRNSVVGYLHRQKLTSEHKSEVHRTVRDNGVKRPKIAVNAQQVNLARLSQPRFKPEPFVLACVEVVPLNLSIMDLQDGDCRFPYGGDDDPATAVTYCGHPSLSGLSWCIHHLRVVKRPTTPPRKPSAPSAGPAYSAPSHFGARGADA